MSQREEYYIAELQRGQKGEDHTLYKEELNLIVEKVYPNLDPDAHEQLVLTQVLASIVNPQVTFSMRQWRLTTVDAAVTMAMKRSDDHDNGL